MDVNFVVYSGPDRQFNDNEKVQRASSRLYGFSLTLSLHDGKLENG